MTSNRRAPGKPVFVDGNRFDSVAALHRTLQSLGFNGSDRVVRKRLRKGVDSLQGLLKSIDENKGLAAREVRLSKRERDKLEMQELIRKLDERKKENV